MAWIRLVSPGMVATRLLTCPRCGAATIRKSMPRDAWERLVRAVSPYHYVLCRTCAFRGVSFGALHRVHEGAEPPRLTARPVEARDWELAYQKRRQTIVSLLIATALGAMMGLYLHGCRHEAEIRAPSILE